MAAPNLDPATTWVISDTHFGHRNIIEFCHRPDDVEQIMMEEWARAIGPEDTVLHLGDLCYRGNAWFKNMIAPNLTGGRKLLIAGNHDKQRPGFYRQCGFKIVRPFSIQYPGLRRRRNWTVSFSHYPWSEADEDSMKPPEYHLRLHGHIHNNGYTRSAFVPFLRNHVNLSVEQTKYRPINLKLLLDGVLQGKHPLDNADPSGEASADAVQTKRGL